MEQIKSRELVKKYGAMILELIDNQDDYTRSDLQGRVSAIIMNIIREVKN